MEELNNKIILEENYIAAEARITPQQYEHILKKIDDYNVELQEEIKIETDKINPALTPRIYDLHVTFGGDD